MVCDAMAVGGKGADAVVQRQSCLLFHCWWRYWWRWVRRLKPRQLPCENRVVCPRGARRRYPLLLLLLLLLLLRRCRTVVDGGREGGD